MHTHYQMTPSLRHVFSIIARVRDGDTQTNR